VPVIALAFGLVACGDPAPRPDAAESTFPTVRAEVVDSVVVELSRVTAVIGLSDSLWLILDPRDGIRLTDIATRETTPAGRRGSGPGEWVRPTDAFLLPDGSGAVILDNGGRTMLHVDAAGRFRDILRGVAVPQRFTPIAALADTIILGISTPELGVGAVYGMRGRATTAHYSRDETDLVNGVELTLDEGTMHEFLSGSNRSRIWQPSSLTTNEPWTAFDDSALVVLRLDGILERHGRAGPIDSLPLAISKLRPTQADLDSLDQRQSDETRQRLAAREYLPVPAGRFHHCGNGSAMVQIRARTAADPAILWLDSRYRPAKARDHLRLVVLPQLAQLAGCSGNHAFVIKADAEYGTTTVYQLLMSLEPLR
jgi:hypothetical protein